MEFIRREEPYSGYVSVPQRTEKATVLPESFRMIRRASPFVTSRSAGPAGTLSVI